MLSWRHCSPRRRRLAGEIDVLDLVIGLCLAAGIPFLCFIGYRILEPRLPQDPFARGGKPAVHPSPDEEEVGARWKHAEEIYANGKSYARDMEGQSDPYLKDYQRQWAIKALLKANDRYGELESLIAEAKDQQAQARFGSFLEQAAARRREIGPEVDKLRQKDMLRRSDDG